MNHGLAQARARRGQWLLRVGSGDADMNQRLRGASVLEDEPRDSRTGFIEGDGFVREPKTAAVPDDVCVRVADGLHPHRHDAGSGSGVFAI